MAAKGNRRARKGKIHHGIVLSDNVFVLIPGAAVNQPCRRRNVERPNRQIHQSFEIGLRQMVAGPFNSLACRGIKVDRIVESGNDAIVVSSNRRSSQFFELIYYFRGVGTVAYEVSATKYLIVSNVAGTAYACFKRLDIRMDVAKDQIPHSV